MSMRGARDNPGDAWDPVSKFFHWSTAIAVVAMFALGWVAVSYPMSPAKIELFNWHKSLGLLILAWVALRAAWRASHPRPAPPPGMSRAERWAAHLSHALLYGLMIAMPLSGWVINSAADFPLKWFGLFQVPQIAAADEHLQDSAEGVHYVLSWTLLCVVLLHVAAAMHHHFARRSDVLRRMLPFVRK